MNLCKGIATKKRQTWRRPCSRMAASTSKYCLRHNYFNKYTDEQVEGFRNGEGKICRNCAKLFEGSKVACSKCLADDIIRKNNPDGRPKCVAVTIKEKPCDCYSTSISKYCNTHSYMDNYTEEQLKNLHNCSTCNLKKYIPQRDPYKPTKTCPSCADTAVEAARKRRAKKKREEMLKYNRKI